MRILSVRSSWSPRRGRGWKALLAIGLLVPLLGVPAQAEDPLDPVLGDPGPTYPNLVPNVQDVSIQAIRFNDSGDLENGRFLWFDTWAQNMGDVPVQLTVDRIESPEVSTVSQCVSWRSADNHVCRETEVVGGFTWHEAHQHFHYNDFARYELRKLAADGRPDYSPEGLVRVSQKASFCLIDSQRIREDAAPIFFYGTCSPTIQGISPGYTDIYFSDLAGQNFPILGVPDGRYAVIVDMDYANTLRETNDDDNYLEVGIEIQGGSAAILSHNWPAPDDRGTTVTTTTTTTTTTLPCKPDKGKKDKDK